MHLAIPIVTVLLAVTASACGARPVARATPIQGSGLERVWIEALGME